LRVASCELRVQSSELRVESCEFRVQSYRAGAVLPTTPCIDIHVLTLISMFMIMIMIMIMIMTMIMTLIMMMMIIVSTYYYYTMYWHQSARRWRSKRGDACCATVSSITVRRSKRGGSAVLRTSLCTIVNQ
jgi:Flp pilus assembly protein TadB